MAERTGDQVNRHLNSLFTPGMSKYEAKKELQQKLGDKYNPTMPPSQYIYSKETLKTYKRACKHFVEWCQERGYCAKNTKYRTLEKYVPEYLDYRAGRGLSAWTLKQDRSALGKLYGHTIHHEIDATRHIDDIKRSRDDAVRDAGFSLINNRDLIDVCRATGGRREDISMLMPSRFSEDSKGHLWVFFPESKGGRDRYAPVLPELETRVREIIADRPEDELLFDHINSHADVHGYRAEYAKALYADVKTDRSLRDQLMQAGHWPSRQRDPHEAKIKSDYYRTKDGSFCGLRDDIWCVTQALGHSRIEVAVRHYLR